MRLVTIFLANKIRTGALEGNLVKLFPLEAGDMVDLIKRGQAEIQMLIDATSEHVALADVKLLSPIQRFNRDILCTGWNYWDHFNESKGKREGQDVDRPSAPTFFTKGPNTVIGPFDDIGLDAHISAKWDYEAEVAIVIGKRCRSVSKAQAEDCIFGYFLANDVSQRDLQRRHGGQWLKGKSIDRTMPLGPFVVTGDELDIENITLELTLNGEVMQKAKLRQMAFPIAEIVAELSFGMTLEVGDVIITGTPAGIGNAREPAIFLKEGDEMIVKATGLGELRNRVVKTDLHGQSDIPSMSKA
ncbi:MULTISPECIES: fumarylacetoacetate hydrolase family protein [unclassified Rhizobium]|uniref:fumarylacetoacetate hydrolase family protein n=1 Tax=unclassified Rhizobium TaxID=2613769 RepID=UPI00288B482E|nr:MULTISPECIES: fumarylacetoacetate hydrolase family protein [unclassified Rhizobium]